MSKVLIVAFIICVIGSLIGYFVSDFIFNYLSTI